MKKLNFLLRTLLGIVIVLILFYKLDFMKVFEVISKYGIFVVFLVIIKYLFETIINSLNYKILLSALGEKISYFRLLKYFLVSYSIGLFSPGKVGDLTIIPLLKKEGIDYGKSALVSIADKLITFVFLVLLSIYGFFLFLPYDYALKISIGLTAFAIILFVVLFSKNAKSFVKKYILRGSAGKFAGFSENLSYLIKHKKNMILLDFILTSIYVFGSAVIVYFTFLYVGISVNPFIIASISSAGKIISLIPISLSGLGIRESASIYFYSLLGISPVVVGSIYLIDIFVYYILAGLLVLLLSRLLLPKDKNLKINKQER